MQPPSAAWLNSLSTCPTPSRMEPRQPCNIRKASVSFSRNILPYDMHGKGFWRLTDTRRKIVVEELDPACEVCHSIEGIGSKSFFFSFSLFIPGCFSLYRIYIGFLEGSVICVGGKFNVFLFLSSSLSLLCILLVGNMFSLIVIDFHLRQKSSVTWREFWSALSSVCIFSSSLTTPNCSV